MRRLVTSVAAGIVLLCAAAPARAEIAPVKVIDEPGDQQISASGNGTWYSFTANSTAHPKRYNAFAVEVGGSPRTRLNPKGSAGGAGNFDPGTNKVIFAQYTRFGSSLLFYDLDTKGRTKVSGVNTRHGFEYSGLVSTSFVLFDRDHRVNGVWYTDLLLYDRVHDATTQLGRWKVGRAAVIPGSVGETTASYLVVQFRSGDNVSYVYDIAGDSRTKIPVATGKFAYSPTIDEGNGDVYYSRSGNGCGANVSIRRLPLADLSATPTVMATMPDGVDAYGLSLAPNTGSGDTDLLFTRYKCSNGTAHIFSLPGVDTV